MANWTGIWEEAEDKLAEILGAALEGIPQVEELPEIIPDKTTCMYCADFHGGGPAVEPDSENYSIKGSVDGGAVEKQVQCTIMAVATTKVLARRFAESIWNGLPVEPSARPIARLWVSAEPNTQRGTWKQKSKAGAEVRVWLVTATLEVLLTKAESW